MEHLASTGQVASLHIEVRDKDGNLKAVRDVPAVVTEDDGGTPEKE